MRSIGYLAFLIVLISSCTKTQKEPLKSKKYSHDVGDILFDPEQDNPKFKLCDSTKIITSRRGLMYDGSFAAVQEACMDQFEFQPSFAAFTGYVVVRFVLNCNKQTDRFRAQTLALDFSLKDCPPTLEKHILSIVKGLNKWEVAAAKNETFDFVKTLNFKIVNGKIENVLQ